MTYQDLGLSSSIEEYRKNQGLEGFEIGRVISEHKERYVLKTPDSEFLGELLGNLRYTANNKSDLPVVGDWVAFSEFDTDKAIIHAVYPRHSILERKAAGKKGQTQPIAANVDVALIVQAVDRDFNLNRLDRYLTISHAASITPIIVLSKTDLIDMSEAEDYLNQIKTRHKNTKVVLVNNQSAGYAEVQHIIKQGLTYCLLGSSGAGKSTLLNGLLGIEAMKTMEISQAVNKGKHTTTHRELHVLPNGGIIIDNPGMREIGIGNTSQAIESTFEDFIDLDKRCKYPDCTHTHEQGCAIIEAVDNDEINKAAYINYIKLEKERQYFESDAQERKKKDKDLGRVIKEFKKQRKSKKF